MKRPALGDVSWPKVVVLVTVILIITRIVAPETAAWIMAPLVELTRAAIAALQDLGGS